MYFKIRLSEIKLKSTFGFYWPFIWSILISWSFSDITFDDSELLESFDLNYTSSPHGDNGKQDDPGNRNRSFGSTGLFYK